MRELTIFNEYGQEFTLDNIDKGIMTKLTGIGFQLEYKYARSGSSWVSNTKRTKQIPIKGEILNAAADPYTAEVELLEFLRRTRKARIRYKTSAGEWFKDIDIVQYDKGEIHKGALRCPVSFMPKTLWYSNDSSSMQIMTGNDGIRYDYRYDAQFNDFANGYVEFDNDGSEGADFSVEFHGGIANPVIVVESEGNPDMVVAIEATVSSGERILFQSKDGEGEHFAYSGTDAAIENFKATGKPIGLTNLVGGFDVENENFFKLPRGLSRIYITADSALVNPVIINTYKYYWVV